MIDSLTSLGGAAAQPALRLVTPSASAQADPAPGQRGTSNAVPASSGDGAKPAPAPKAATRIMVHRSDAGIYVYRLVDVATGRTLAELPRGESDKLKLTSDYTPGALAATSA